MKKLILLLLACGTLFFAKAQTNASDFTITSTDGQTLNLYSALNSGHTIMLDFFFVTCSYCIQYAPTIENAYQAHGHGTGMFNIWGIDYHDDNASVVAYRNTYGVTNPCASGTQGGANAVSDTCLTNKYGNFTGWPTYTLICPDKHVFWDVNYPPSAVGFDSYLTDCSSNHQVSGIDQPKNLYANAYNAYPNPAVDQTSVSFGLGADADVTFEIKNILGQTVTSIHPGILGQGYHTYSLDLSNLNSGNYMISFLCKWTIFK